MVRTVYTVMDQSLLLCAGRGEGSGKAENMIAELTKPGIGYATETDRKLFPGGPEVNV
jgi:hypothetical protein